MATNKQDQRRQLVGEFLVRHPQYTCTEVWQHFKKMDFKRTIVYDTSKKVKEGKSIKRKPGSGRKTKSGQEINKNLEKKIADWAHKKGITNYSAIGRKFKLHRDTIKKILMKHVDKKVRKKIPKTNEKQKKKQKRILREVSRNQFAPCNDDVDILLDDESYFEVSEQGFGGNKFYFVKKGQEASPEVKYIQKDKFPPKVLLWIAISKQGTSSPCFRLQNCHALKSGDYVKYCLTRLKKFIDHNYSDGNYLFWPDLASCHYSKYTSDKISELNIKRLGKEKNPPNIPQLRPIEDFFASLKSRVYKEGWKPRSPQHLISRINNKIKTFPPEYFKKLMSGIPAKIRKADRQGVAIAYH